MVNIVNVTLIHHMTLVSHFDQTQQEPPRLTFVRATGGTPSKIYFIKFHFNELAPPT